MDWISVLKTLPMIPHCEIYKNGKNKGDFSSNTDTAYMQPLGKTGGIAGK